MPLRFRKSIKILPGVKINLSKSGVSTSFGKRGSSINIGKKGIRSTVGMPGTGFSFSKLFSVPKVTLPKTGFVDQSDAPPDYYPQPSSTDVSTKPIGKAKIKIPFGCLVPTALIAMCLQVFVCFSSISGIIKTTPTPTQIDTKSIQEQVFMTAWAGYTQTAAALPTNTLLPTETPLPTQTPLPTSTIAPTSTPMPTATTFIYIAPTLAVVPGSQNSGSCCKVCGANSKACGDSCISLSKTCHQPPGCACD
jgi:hypothetical protein